MINNLNGKKLLLLGGIGPTNDLIGLAHRNGVTVGVADYNKDTPVKKMADAQHEVNALDVEAVVDLFKKYQYDGIISNFVDLLLPYVARVAKAVNKWSPFDEEQVRMSTDKEYFKKTCIKYGVPVPKEYAVDGIDGDMEAVQIDFPVIVKPVDGSGSKGITVCNDRAELLKGVERARSNSRSGKVIVEDYLPYDEINLTYVAQDGDIRLAAIHDRYFNTSQKDVVKVPDMYIYPSRYTDLVYEKYNDKIINMFRQIGIKNGSIFLQAVVKEDQMYIYEAGMRLNGCKTYQILEVENNFNTFERLMSYALTGSMGEFVPLDARFKRWYATWNVVGAPGMVCQTFEGLEDLASKEWVISVARKYFEGEEIPENAKGTLIQLVARIHVYGDTKEELLERIDYIQKTFKVKDGQNRDVLLQPHAVSDLREKLNYDLSKGRN